MGRLLCGYNVNRKTFKPQTRLSPNHYLAGATIVIASKYHNYKTANCAYNKLNSCFCGFNIKNESRYYQAYKIENKGHFGVAVTK